MKKATTRFLSGVGSLLAIMPGTNYAQYVPKQTAAERMRSHWENTGNHIRTAIDQYQNEQKHHYTCTVRHSDSWSVSV